MVKPHSGEADEQGIKDDVVADADASESDSEKNQKLTDSTKIKR